MFCHRARTELRNNALIIQERFNAPQQRKKCCHKCYKKIYLIILEEFLLWEILYFPDRQLIMRTAVGHC
jgi:hypothetical protein